MLTVLLVDDSATDREAYARALAHAGFTAIEAADPLTAYKQVTETLPDLIVVDVMMPGVLDGIELTRKFTFKETTRTVPIIVLTAFVDTRADAERAGAAAFLTKPCSPDVLVANVRRLLSARL